MMLVPATVRAETETYANATIGPVLGISWGGISGRNLLIGVEGGIGYLWVPQRVNVGIEHRDAKWFAYFEVDPWLLIGASVGAGIDSDGESKSILGVWEAVPLGSSCVEGENRAGDDWRATSALSIGYRYSGVHELYASIKAGVVNDCIGTGS